jgi:CBS-domain-containing membrane protein
VQTNALTAADLMTRPLVTTGADEPVSHAARLMFDRRVKRLPVISDDGTLIGIVSRSDVLRMVPGDSRGRRGILICSLISAPAVVGISGG